MVKTYELPPKPKQADQNAGNVLQGLKRMGTGMGTLTGLGGKPPAQGGETSAAGADANVGPVRQGLNRMGTWGFGGRGTENATNLAAEEEDDDRRIRFTIGGAGRRLTKEDFLKEMRGLDPKARSEIIAESDAPQSMKTMAKKDASPNIPGSDRLFSAKNVQVAPGSETANIIAAEMARQRGASIVDESEDEDYEDGMRNQPRARSGTVTSTRPRGSSNADMTEESAVERMRREKALRGTDTTPSPPRGRHITRDEEEEEEEGDEGETAAEKRRREAALGVGDELDDSDDDDTPRVPPPVARSRGIRFAQSPVRGK